MLEQFEFANFTPTDDLLLKAAAALNSTLSHAPSDSSATAVLEKVGDTFTCHIEVRASVGHFTGEAARELPQTAIAVATHKINDALKNWRDTLNLAPMHLKPTTFAFTTDQEGHYDMDGVSLDTIIETKVIVAGAP